MAVRRLELKEGQENKKGAGRGGGQELMMMRNEEMKGVWSGLFGGRTGRRGRTIEGIGEERRGEKRG